MSNSKGAFLAAYYIVYPATYFNKVLMVSELAQHPNPTVAAARDQWMKELKESGGQFVMQIKEAIKIAENFGIAYPPLPRFPEEYFNWVSELTQNFNQKFPSQSKEGLAFQLGFDLANTASNLSIMYASLFLQKETANVIDKTAQVQHLIKDSFNSDFKSGGTAMLLSMQLSNDAIREEWIQLSDQLKSTFDNQAPVIDSNNVTGYLEKTNTLLGITNQTIKKVTTYL